MSATLGVRDHSGWVALVAPRGSPTAPVVVDRQKDAAAAAWRASLS